MAGGGTDVKGVEDRGCCNSFVGVEDDAGFGVEAGASGQAGFGVNAVGDEAFAVVVVVVRGEESGVYGVGDVAGFVVDGGEFPGDFAGLLVEGGFKVYVVAEGVSQI